ncbi:hypothetical protein NECAME_05960, partial [Necator americanus]
MYLCGLFYFTLIIIIPVVVQPDTSSKPHLPLESTIQQKAIVPAEPLPRDFII